MRYDKNMNTHMIVHKSIRNIYSESDSMSLHSKSLHLFWGLDVHMYYIYLFILLEELLTSFLKVLSLSAFLGGTKCSL